MLVKREDVEEAIITLLDGNEIFPYELEPKEINNGLCDEFANCVCALLNFPENLKPDCATDIINSDFCFHVWLTLTLEDGSKLYFDAECEYGTTDLNNIPYFLDGR